MITPRQKTFGPTQKDIGLTLNLAQSTVAVALNPKLRSRLPAETVALIEKRAAEMGYRPQRMARILRNGRSHTIGAVYRSGTYHAPQERVKLLAQSALRRGYQLVALDLDWFDSDHRAAEDYLLGSAVEGVVLCNFSYDYKTPSFSWENFLEERGLPALGMSSITRKELNGARADMSDGFLRMTRHHLEQGSRHLELLMPFRDREMTSIAKGVHSRVDGFCQGIIEAGGEVVTDKWNSELLNLPVKPKTKSPKILGRVHYPIWPEGVKDVFELGAVMMHSILEQGGKLPDSLICSNDQIAAGVLSVCLPEKIDIPGQLLISGADDAPFSRFCGVPLTTIAQPAEAIVEWSIERIVQLIESEEERSVIQAKVFPCELITRRSTQRLA